MPVEATSNLRAPDFLIFVNYNNTTIPLLVECKTTTDNKLVWSENYLNSLKDFAAVLRLPLLVARKYGHMWLVVDSSHFQKKVTADQLAFETAAKENLMSLLFGNLWITVNDKTSFRIDAKIIDAELDSNKELIDEGTYTFEIEKAGFYVGEALIETLSGRCSEILFSTFGQNVVEKLEGNRVRIIYHPLEDSRTIQLYDLLLIDLYIKSREEGEIVWAESLLEGPFDSSGETFRNAIAQPGTSQFIDFVGHQRPTTIPGYLKEI
jgi:Holliday junction resolvase